MSRSDFTGLGACGAAQVQDQGSIVAQPEGGKPGPAVRRAGPVVNAGKLDEGAEPGSLDRVSAEVRQAMQKARLDKKMSQAELAKLINERPQVVQEYENGKAVPNQTVLAKMEKAPGVKLRGKIGE